MKGMHFQTKKRYSFYILLIMCIVVDICDRAAAAADIFFTFPPAGPQTKGLVKQQTDFPTQLALRRMNCLFITAGGRKVRVFELVGCCNNVPRARGPKLGKLTPPPHGDILQRKPQPSNSNKYDTATGFWFNICHIYSKVYR